jgi:hypothetical protein
MFPVGFEPIIPASELPHVHAPVSGPTGMALVSRIRVKFHVVTTSVPWTDRRFVSDSFSTTSFRMA